MERHDWIAKTIKLQREIVGLYFLQSLHWKQRAKNAPATNPTDAIPAGLKSMSLPKLRVCYFFKLGIELKLLLF